MARLALMEARLQYIMGENILIAFDRLKDELIGNGIQAEVYVMRGYDGYRAVTGRNTSDVYCLEANLGRAKYKEGLELHAMLQVFDPKHPNLSLMAVYLRDHDGALAGDVAVLDKNTDRKLSLLFIPAAYRAFNMLDPSGKNKSQVVQRYAHISIALEEFLPALYYTVRLAFNFKELGQLAQIAVDFRDAGTRLIDLVARPLAWWGGIHNIPSARDVSEVEIPLRGRRDQPEKIHRLSSSTALDRGIKIAYECLEKNNGQD